MDAFCSIYATHKQFITDKNCKVMMWIITDSFQGTN